MDIAVAADAAPWYRHRWPWFLMAGPAIAVVAGFVTLGLALRSDDGLVADDYYKQGLAINRTIARAERATALAVAARVDVSADGAIRVAVEGTGPLATPPELRVSFVQPTHAGRDVRVTLARGADGRYEGRLAPLRAGRWQVVVESDAWRLPSIEASAPFEPLTLRADAPLD